MEIKKTSLGKIKEMLTRDQMKKIKGGLSSYQCCPDSGTASCSPCGSYLRDDSCPMGEHKNAC